MSARTLRLGAGAVALAALLTGGCHAAQSSLRSLWGVERPTQGQPPGGPDRAAVVLADFNRPGHRTNAGHPFGAWESDPGDATQSCRVRLVESERLGDTGYGLMIEYDVESPNPAYCGFWMKLLSVPLADFETLSFAIKGSARRGFTERLWVELKDETRAARFPLEGVSADWTRMRIPLSAFLGIRHVRRATEFVIVFDDETVTQPVGAIYLDDVVLATAP